MAKELTIKAGESTTATAAGTKPVKVKKPELRVDVTAAVAKAQSMTGDVKSKLDALIKSIEVPAEELKEKAKREKKPSARLSASGTFSNLRHLMEFMFVTYGVMDEKNPNGINFERAIAAVKMEFPANTKFNKAHYNWYKIRIVNNSETHHKNEAGQVETLTPVVTA